MKIPYTPIKIVENFFESATLWRLFALDQTFSYDSNICRPGLYSKNLIDLDINLFNGLARKLINHCHGAKSFLYLQARFISISKIYNTDWIKQDNLPSNLSGFVFLNEDNILNTGLNFYTLTKPFENDFVPYMMEEYSSKIDTNKNFIEEKLKQKEYFKINMSLENEFNRCVMFHPKEWYNFSNFFGDSVENSSLVLWFNGKFA